MRILHDGRSSLKCCQIAIGLLLLLALPANAEWNGRTYRFDYIGNGWAIASNDAPRKLGITMTVNARDGHVLIGDQLHHIDSCAGFNDHVEPCFFGEFISFLAPPKFREAKVWSAGGSEFVLRGQQAFGLDGREICVSVIRASNQRGWVRDFYYSDAHGLVAIVLFGADSKISGELFVRPERAIP